MSEKIPTFKTPFEFDQLLLEPVHEMMKKGILIDQKRKSELQAMKLEEWFRYQKVLDEVVGQPFNVESKKFVPLLLYKKLGLPSHHLTDKKSKVRKITANEDAIRKTMAECAAQVEKLKTEEARQRYKLGYIICFHILKIRSVRKQISSFLGLQIKKGKLHGPVEFEDPDGRIRGTISVGGTETFRFSHSKTLWDTGINLATNPKDIRDMYIPDPGYEFAEFDLNRGESWIYAHLSEDPELLRIHTKGFDFHAETAAAISLAYGKPLDYDWIVEHKDDDAFKIRYLGKRKNHAGSYRMGEFKEAEIINGEAEDTGITVTVADCKKSSGLWHQKYFMIKQWWKEVEAQLGKDRTMRTPYGRIHTFHDQWGEGLFKAATAYVPQSTSVDYINRGFLKVYHLYQKTKTWDMSILAQSHDSLLIQYKKEYRHEAVPEISRQLVSELTIKNRTFSIPVEVKVGDAWGKGEKYKGSEG